jgi:hypothetical protein
MGICQVPGSSTVNHALQAASLRPKRYAVLRLSAPALPGTGHLAATGRFMVKQSYENRMSVIPVNRQKNRFQAAFFLYSIQGKPGPAAERGTECLRDDPS